MNANDLEVIKQAVVSAASRSSLAPGVLATELVAAFEILDKASQPPLKTAGPVPAPQREKSLSDLMESESKRRAWIDRQMEREKFQQDKYKLQGAVGQDVAAHIAAQVQNQSTPGLSGQREWREVSSGGAMGGTPIEYGSVGEAVKAKNYAGRSPEEAQALAKDWYL